MVLTAVAKIATKRLWLSGERITPTRPRKALIGGTPRIANTFSLDKESIIKRILSR
jgi:hypothetical protein